MKSSLSCCDGHFICYDENGNVWYFTFVLLSRCYMLSGKVNGLENIVHVSCGEQFSACIDNNGIIWTFGNVPDDLKERNDTLYIGKIFRFPFHDSFVTHVSCGRHHMIWLNENGELFGCGSNQVGELGINDFIVKPKKLLNHIYFREIGCGSNYSVAISLKGELYGCGIGFKDIMKSRLNYKFWNKEQSGLLSDLRGIACGKLHILVFDGNNDIYGMGNNESGQLGLNDSIVETYQPTKLDIKILSQIRYITCTNYSSMILEQSGILWTCGYIEQISTDKICKMKQFPIDNIIAIGATEYCIILKTTNDIYCLTSNSRFPILEIIESSNDNSNEFKFKEDYNYIIANPITHSKLKSARK